MTRKVLDYRAPQTQAPSSSIVHVERSPSGGVVVRVSFPPGQLKAKIIATAISCLSLAAFPISFIWFSGWSMPGLNGFAYLAWIGMVALFTSPLIFYVSRLAQTYTLEADRAGLIIHRYRGRREWSERLPRQRITDVLIGFGSAGKSGRSTAWLRIVLSPRHRFNRNLLHDLGGDNLARVADALREGLGLPPADWPSGRPRQVTPAGAVTPPHPPSRDSERIKERIFGIVFTALGLPFTIFGIRDAYQTYQRLHRLHQTTCTLLDKRITYGVGGHTSGRRSTTHYETWARLSYTDARGPHTVAGDFFPTNETENGRPPLYVLQGMTVGRQYPLWTDDHLPGQVCLSRGNDSPWSYSVMIIGGIIFTLAGLATAIGSFVHPQPKQPVTKPAKPMAQPSR